MARRGARAGVIVNAQALHALVQLLRLKGGLLLRLDLRLALAVGRLGLLEDADNVLALWEVSPRVLSVRVLIGSIGALTLLTTFPLLLMTVIVSPTPIAAVDAGPAAAQRVEEESCNRNGGCGVVLVCSGKSVSASQCVGT